MGELSLEQRVARLEAGDRIRAMKALYCDLCDRGYDPDGLAALFAEDAVWDGGIFGRYEGRAAIYEFFKGISGTLTFAAHLVMNPIITVIDDDTATGQWRLWQPVTATEPSGPVSKILVAAYEDIYVQIEGQWLYKSLTLTVNFFEPLSEGWARTAVP